MREFEGKTIELLAPAGNFKIFKKVVKSKCDAVYYGGKSLNMRMIRKGFNFSDEELEEAVYLSHKEGKKSYITVNNLIKNSELDTAKKYLKILDSIKVDGIIIQDFSILKLVEKLNLDLEIHSSVMMNVHNLNMIKAVKKQGVNRVVLSREASLREVEIMKNKTDIEIEYFTHGDMCSAVGSQCYYSSMLFGMSSNRGRCLKPCRWWYNEEINSKEKSFPMAVKDMCMYKHIPEMIKSGVTSFKLEGRMREADFIVNLINLYGDAMDRYIADPLGYDRDKNFKKIYETRKRDLSTAYAFGKPGIKNINKRYEGTGKFYSTGKMFSKPKEEEPIKQESIYSVNKILKRDEIPSIDIKLSVKVNNIKQAEAAVQGGADIVYLAGDVLKFDRPFTVNQIKKFKEKNKNIQIFLGTPKVMKELEFQIYDNVIPKVKKHMDGILATNIGAIEKFKVQDLKINGDYTLNIFNKLAAELYHEKGLDFYTASIELNAQNLKDLLNSTEKSEVIVYGKIPVMSFEHDFHEIYYKSNNEKVSFYNEVGEFSIHKDQYDRSHMFNNKKINLIPIIESLITNSVDILRIEAQLESPNNIKDILSVIKKKVNGEEVDYNNINIKESTFGALKFEKESKK